jgi:hypothetical protein
LSLGVWVPIGRLPHRRHIDARYLITSRHQGLQCHRDAKLSDFGRKESSAGGASFGPADGLRLSNCPVVPTAVIWASSTTTAAPGRGPVIPSTSRAPLKFWRLALCADPTWGRLPLALQNPPADAHSNVPLTGQLISCATHALI